MPSSAKLPLSGLTEGVGMTRNGDFGAVKRSPGLARDFMYLPSAAGENGSQQSWFPAVGHEREGEMRKFDVPSMESTLNQPAMLETLYSDPHYRAHFPNPRPDTNKDVYKVLPESKKAPGSGAVFERNGPHASSSGVLPLGLQPAPGLSKSLSSQVWQPSPDPWHPGEQSCELSTCRQQLELIRLQMEQMQLQNGAMCHHPAAFAPLLPTLEPAQWLSILNSNEHLLKEKELLIDKQRKHISQLEQKVRESELQVHSALLGRPAPFGDVCLLRLQELQRENTFLRAQFAQKTEALSKEKMEQLHSQVQSQKQELAQEEGINQALREEAQRRETALQQMRTAVKELSVQNQDLIEKNLTLQEHLRQAQPGSSSSPDSAQLACELHQELASCLQDLQAVCSIVTQRAQGHNPNLSLLLGIHSTQHPGTQLDLQKPDVIRRKLEEVQQLRHDIEDLRTSLSDRYAQDMGENCATQ